MEDFKVHGTYSLTNQGGYEIMISDNQEMAKIRVKDGTVSEWLIIALIYCKEYDDWFPMIDPKGYNIPLNDIMRLN